MTERNQNTSSTARLVAGLLIIVLGIALFFERIDIVRSVDLGELWPLILIAIGVVRTANAASAKERRGGLTLLFLGAWFLVVTTGLFGADWDTSWPLALVAVGLAKTLASSNSAARGAGLLLVAIGAGLQVAVLELWGLELEDTWPFAIVAVGLWLMVTAFSRSRRSA